VITKQLRSNAAGDPVLAIRVTGAHDVYRFAHGMQTLQVEFARKGTLALTGLRRMIGKQAYGFLVDAFHGDGRHFEIDRRSPYDRGYTDSAGDKTELLVRAAQFIEAYAQSVDGKSAAIEWLDDAAKVIGDIPIDNIALVEALQGSDAVAA